LVEQVGVEEEVVQDILADLVPIILVTEVNNGVAVAVVPTKDVELLVVERVEI
jgi:hypothetical protein